MTERSNPPILQPRRRFLVFVGSGAAAFLFVTVIVTTAFYAGASASHREVEAQRTAAEAKADTETRLARCQSEQGIGKMSSCVEAAVKLSREERLGELDLQAQQEMARWARWLLIATLAQLPISLFGLVALLLTIAQSNRALEHARDISQIQLRPYVLPDFVTIRHLRGKTWQVRQRLYNVGVIPATRVLARTYVRLVDLPLPDDLPEFMEDFIEFDHISSRRSVHMNRLVDITKRDIEHIKEKKSGILVRTNLKYRSANDSDWEEFYQDRIFILNDIFDGRARIIPSSVYVHRGQRTEIAQSDFDFMPPETDR